MREIIILGRGGQGAQTAGNLLAQAFYEQGQQVQTFATYGGARRGTAVISKSVKPAHLLANFAALEIELEPGEMERISRMNRHYRYINGAFFAGKNSPYTKADIWDE